MVCLSLQMLVILGAKVCVTPDFDHQFSKFNVLITLKDQIASAIYQRGLSDKQFLM